MRKTAIFVAGLAVGVYLARQIEAHPDTKRKLDEAGEKIRVFANAVSDGYREQEVKNNKSSNLKSAK